MIYKILPIGTFSISFLGCFIYGKYNKSFCKYTTWNYIENISLLPYLLFEPTRSLTADIIWCNSIGLLGGIHCFYAVTGYKLLKEFGEKLFKVKQNFIIYLMSDLVVHGLPTIFSIYYLRKIKQQSNHIWLLTAIPHTFYCYALYGSFHPDKLYKVKKRKDLQIFLGWSGIFFSHKLAIELRKKLTN